MAGVGSPATVGGSGYQPVVSVPRPVPSEAAGSVPAVGSTTASCHIVGPAPEGAGPGGGTGSGSGAPLPGAVSAKSPVRVSGVSGAPRSRGTAAITVTEFASWHGLPARACSWALANVHPGAWTIGA